MDWYYPVLGGVVRGAAAAAAAAGALGRVRRAGARRRGASSDQPWVTGAETCELALALDAIGERDAALALLAEVQHLRDADGSYWTGYVFEDGARWPVERSTWTAAAVVLAVDALSRTTPASGIFRGEGLPKCFELHDPACGCGQESLSGAPVS